MRRLNPGDAETVIARDSVSRKDRSTLVIGAGGLLDPTDGFTVRREELAAGAMIDEAPSDRQEVVFVHRGSVTAAAADGDVELAEGDTMSLPGGVPRRYRASEPTSLFRVNAL